MFDLHGKTALVTGSSRGIGRAILLALAKQGATVILHCRKPCEQADSTLAELAQMGATCHVVYADLARIDGANQLHSQVADLGVNVDILFINASIELRRHWTEITDEEYDAVLSWMFLNDLEGFTQEADAADAGFIPDF